MKISDRINIKITSPKEVVWEGSAIAISSVNSEGPFDVLPGHANFITLIKDKPIIIHKKGVDKKFKFKRAVLYNRNDKIVIYITSDSDIKEEND